MAERTAGVDGAQDLGFGLLSGSPRCERHHHLQRHTSRTALLALPRVQDVARRGRRRCSARRGWGTGREAHVAEERAIDLAAWLRGLGLDRYEAAFRDNDVDAAVLPTLTAEDLKELGVSSVGHRRRLLDAIAALRGMHSTVPAEPPSAAPAAPPIAEATSAERRQVTVLF